MGEANTATPVTRKATAGGNNASRATTPVTSNADGTRVASKKRPRSETPSNSAATDAGEGNADNNDENQNNSNTDTIGGNPSAKKKKKTSGIGIGESSLSSSSSLTFEDEIAIASSDATGLILKSSLHRLMDGIPRRELKLIVSEARVCEAALEDEIRILQEGLRLEQLQQTQTKPQNSDAAKNNATETTAAAVPNSKPSNAKGGVAEKASETPGDSPPAADNYTKNSGIHNTDKKNDSSTTSPLTQKETTALETMLESEFTPPDTHWTLSALLGRLRHELTTPLPPRSQLPVHREQQGLTQLAQNVGVLSQSTYKKRGPKPPQPLVPTAAAATITTTTAAGTCAATATAIATVNTSGGSAAATTTTNNAEVGTAAEEATTPTTAASSEISKKASNGTSTTHSTTPSVTSSPSNSLQNEFSQFKRLGSLPDHAEYRRDHTTPDKLLAVWKKLSTHRSSLVFRRPVNPKEAPGYTERIRFPMDLSLMRKLIMSKHIQTYKGILKQVHLIGHNCVKYNGRESDYALVTREFESVATEYVWNAVMRETYGGSRGRWSRNASPMPPSSSTMTTTTTSAAVASPPASAATVAAAAASTATSPKPTVVAAPTATTTSGSATGGTAPATTTTASGATGSSTKS